MKIDRPHSPPLSPHGDLQPRAFAPHDNQRHDLHGQHHHRRNNGQASHEIEQQVTHRLLRPLRFPLLLPGGSRALRRDRVSVGIGAVAFPLPSPSLRFARLAAGSVRLGVVFVRQARYGRIIPVAVAVGCRCYNLSGRDRRRRTGRRGCQRAITISDGGRIFILGGPLAGEKRRCLARFNITRAVLVGHCTSDACSEREGVRVSYRRWRRYCCAVMQ